MSDLKRGIRNRILQSYIKKADDLSSKVDEEVSQPISIEDDTTKQEESPNDQDGQRIADDIFNRIVESVVNNLDL